jgi:hypothetical protein
VGRTILLHGDDLKLLAVDRDATLGVDLIDGHQLGFGHRVLGDGHGAGAGMKDTHLHFAVEIAGGLFTTAAGHEGQAGGQRRGTGNGAKHRLAHQDGIHKTSTENR